MFAGRTRANCYFCFFQRQYEFLWLSEVHPKLYDKAESLEKDDYSFIQGLPLKKLREPEVAAKIFERRTKDVRKAIKAKYQGSLFGEPGDNELALTSCGLLCGK